MTERRREPRTPVLWPVRIWMADVVLDGTATDVSPHGICIVTAPTADIKVGASYRIEVLAGLEKGRTFVGEVRHVDQGGHVGFSTESSPIVTS